MRKIGILLLLGMGLSLLSQVYAYSSEFSLLVETMGLEMKNPKGLSLNEEVYQEYSLFVYGSPLQAWSGQRWKEVAEGHWCKGAGAWKGTGIRGEYWILGENYDGKEVHNHRFPVDIEPPTPPTQWRYAVLPDALESWQNANEYMEAGQREYMLTQKLTRNEETFDLTVLDIGLDKVRLENYATWKSKGTVYTQRYDQNQKRWAANFLIPPMAGDAELVGYAEFPQGKEYEVPEEAEHLSIPIVYGAEMTQLTDYAKPEHVKQIKSQLWVNGEKISEVEGTEQLQIEKQTVYSLTKENWPANTVLFIPVEVRSTLVTKFLTDGALVDIQTYTLTVVFGKAPEEEIPKEENQSVSNETYRNYEMIPPPNITSVEIKRIVEGTEKDLLIAKKTGEKFICAGQTLSFRVKAINLVDTVTLEFDGDTSIHTLDELTKRFEWTEPRSRNQKTIVSSLSQLEKMYRGGFSLTFSEQEGEEAVYVGTYVIPYQTKQTLHSWSTLREQSQNAFQMEEEKLFTRIKRPYQLVFKAKSATGADTKRINLDVFERWDTLYNRDLRSYVES